jgi:CheY-like chemotaxis protein/nitrogen-specific signal transduction histidine kinase
MRDEHGALVGYSKVTRDLTERRRAEDENAARLAAEQANRTKDEFLAMLGHELRNPLAPIATALQLIKLRGDSRSAREYQVIERQVKQMTRLVDDLLDVSRISRGKIELKKEQIDLRDVLARAAEIAIPLFDRKNHRLDVTVPDAPLMLDGDDSRLTQVFANLLNNAAKYTDVGGKIALRVERAEREIVVEISDNGIGLDPQLLPRVFELFVQGYQDADRAEGGLGIGLTLVRSLVELHGGKVAAHSAGRGKGSTFTVRLPATETAAVTARSQTTVPMPRVVVRRKVLVVDDNDDARMLLADVLASYGHEVESAAAGEAALALLGTFTPDVAILDIGLPGMDGYELARRMRALPALAGVRLLALTGYGQAGDVAQTKEAGFDVHLVKPIDVRRLLEHIAAT